MSATGVAVGAIVAMGTAPIFAGILEFFVKKKPPLRFWYLSTLLAVLGCCFLLFPSVESIHVDKFGILFSPCCWLLFMRPILFLFLLFCR